MKIGIINSKDFVKYGTSKVKWDIDTTNTPDNELDLNLEEKEEAENEK